MAKRGELTMPDSKGELKRYQFDPTWEMGRGISPLVESSGGNLVKWIDHRAALTAAEQRIEELEKKVGKLESGEPEWTCPNCGNTDDQEGFRTLKHESISDPTEYDIECVHCGSKEPCESPLEALAESISQCERLKEELTALRAEREKELKDLVNFLGLRGDKTGNGWSEEIWCPDGRKKALAAFLAQQKESGVPQILEEK